MKTSLDIPGTHETSYPFINLNSKTSCFKAPILIPEGNYKIVPVAPLWYGVQLQMFLGHCLPDPNPTL